MRKFYFKNLGATIAITTMVWGNVWGQVSAYSFAQSSGTYTSVSSPTTIHASGWDDAVTSVAIPFSFNFNGAAYTSCNVSTNGYITFGSTAPGNTDYSPISQAVGYSGAISALGRDLISNTSTIVHGTVGTSPNREFVIQWNDARRYFNTSARNGNYNFQIRLSETSNIIKIVYNVATSSYGTDIPVQIGLRGSSNSNILNRTSSTNFSSTSAGTANSETVVTGNTAAKNPTAGLTYTYTPPSCFGPTITATTTITSATATINWTAPSPAPSNGYQWEVRSSGAGGSGGAGLVASGTVAAGVLTASATGLAGSTGYTVYVRSDCGGSGFSAWSSGGAFTTLKTEPTNQVTALAAGTVTASAIPLTWTAAAAGAQAPDGYLIKASDASLVAIADPSDGSDPADVTAFTSGSANKKQTTGSATSTTSFTSMTAGTMYYYKVYSYTNSGTGIDFNITSPAALNHATLPNAATSPVFSTTTFTGTTLTWTAPAAYNASNHTTLVFVKATSAVTAGTPTSDPASYTANTTFASGTAFQGDASAYCVYSGDGTSVTITGLSASTTYHVRILTVVDAANSNGNRSYSTGLVGNVTTLKAEPTNQITALTAGAVTASAIPLTWTAAAAGAQAPDGYLIKASDASLVAIADPSDGTDPADVTAFTSGSANKKQTTGSATSTTSFTSMTAGTMYYYKVYSYTNSGTGIDFNITSPAALNHATLPNAATLPVFSATAATGTTISWTAPVAYNASNHTTLVFVKATSAVTAGTPTNDPASYTANTAFASGTAFQGDASAYCVYNGDGTSVSITGLSASTTYHIRILTVVDAANSNGNRSYSAGLTGNVTTLCASVTSFPHSEPFATYLPSTCWNEGIAGTVSGGPITISSTASDWIADGYLNVGTTGAAKINIDVANVVSWLISPSFTIPSAGYRLKYSVGATEFADIIAPSIAWETDDSVDVMISTSYPTNWVLLKTYKTSNVPSHLGITESLDLSAYSGQNISIAFRAVEGAANGSADIDFFVDNFVVEQIPAPTITSVTSSQTCHDTTKIVIIGTNLTGASAASINGVSLGTLDSNTDTRIVRYMLTPFTSGGNVSVTTSGGTATFGNSLSFSNPPALSLDSPNFTICKGTSTLVSLTSTPSNFATYNWSAGVSGSGSGPWTFSPSATTTYNLTATGGGCIKIISRTVTMADTPSRLTLSQGITKPQCSQRIDSLMASGGIVTISYSNIENFTGSSMPSSWNFVNGISSTFWAINSGNTAGGAANELRLDANGAGVSDNNTWTASLPVINASSYTSGFQLSFNTYLNTYSATTYPSTLRVQTSTNNSTWSDAWTYTPSGSTAYGPTTVTVPLTPLQTSATVYIRFNFSGRPFGIYTWNIDDVVITANSNQQQNITWSPTAGLFTDRAASAGYTTGHATKLYSKPSTTTKYYAQSSYGICSVRDSIIDSAKATTDMVILALGSASGASVQCTDGGWTYYGTTADPDKLIFAIQKGAWTNGNETVSIGVNGSPYSSTLASNGPNQHHRSWLMGRDWDVTAATQPASPVLVRFFYDPADTAAVNTDRDVAFAALPGGTIAVKTPFEWFKTTTVPYNAAWRSAIVGNKFPATHIKLTPTYGTQNGVNYAEFSIASFSGGTGGAGFGPSGFGPSGGVGLPVTWAGLDVKTVEAGNELIWKTASEQNTHYFEVQYSYDAKEFIAIPEHIPAAGNSADLRTYNFIHSDFAPFVYYRIKQVDLDSKFEYSAIKLAKRTAGPSFVVNVFPIPIQDDNLIHISAKGIDKSTMSITMTDITGKVIRHLSYIPSVESIKESFDMSPLTPGVYFIEVLNGQGKETFKVSR